jgi:hypothetical protein
MTDQRTNDQEPEVSPLGQESMVSDLTDENGEELTEDEQRQRSIQTVDEALEYITSWANRGTMRQFHTEVSARLSADHNHDVELDDETLVFYNVRKEGGILGIGGKTVREPVLKLVQDGEMIRAADDPLDPDFALELTRILSRH